MLVKIKESIADCIQKLIVNDNSLQQCIFDKIKIEYAKHAQHGDVSTNAAMVFAKQLNMSVRDLANELIEHLMGLRCVKNVECVGPGFINIYIGAESLQDELKNVLLAGKNYSYSNRYEGLTANVEFVSANPTGPLHTGHARNAVIGSCMANLLEKIGYKVTREFYVNDRGGQITMLGKSLYYRYLECCGQDMSRQFDEADMYHGEYVKSWAEQLHDQHGDKLPVASQASDTKHVDECISYCADYAIDQALQQFKTDLADIGVVMDTYTSEKKIMSDKAQEIAFDMLVKQGNIYEGVLPKPKGIDTDADWEEKPQQLFRSTDYGDDSDRALRKSNGDWTYFASDIAYHYYKLNRGFNRLVNIFGADHIGYVKRIKAAVNALSSNERTVDFEIILYQLVNFLDNGVPVKMSKRAGTFITLRDVIDKVGKDVTRYTMISRDSNSVLDFDFTKAVETSMDNPLFYIQYCHARICSVFRNYEAVFNDTQFNDDSRNMNAQDLVDCVDVSQIKHESELALIKRIVFYPEFILGCAKALEPHRVTVYLRELAQDFHYLWNQGKLNNELRFIDPSNKSVTLARMLLLKATQIVIQDALEILDIEPILEMK